VPSLAPCPSLSQPPHHSRNIPHGSSPLRSCCPHWKWSAWGLSDDGIRSINDTSYLCLPKPSLIDREREKEREIGEDEHETREPFLCCAQQLVAFSVSPFIHATKGMSRATCPTTDHAIPRSERRAQRARLGPGRHVIRSSQR
jgi:hypothetical protein